MSTIVDFRINETLQIGAVGNSAYQVRGESVCLFFEFTINQLHMSPRWGFRYGKSRLLYTYRPAGAMLVHSVNFDSLVLGFAITLPNLRGCTQVTVLNQ